MIRTVIKINDITVYRRKSEYSFARIQQHPFQISATGERRRTETAP